VARGIVWIVSLTLAGALATDALAHSAPRAVAPTPGQRATILRAFGDPGAPARCLGVRLAASDRAYATVRFHARSGCRRWGFNGVNVLRKVHAGHWKVAFAASSYTCPRPRIPRQVQRELGICP
jgi:hypothetical protein